MTNINKAINKKLLLFTLIIIPFIKPAIINESVQTLYNIFNIYKVLSTFIIMILFFNNLFKKRITVFEKRHLYFCLFWAIWIMNNYINNVEKNQILINFLNIIIPLWFTIYELKNNNEKIIITAWKNISYIYIIFQLASVILMNFIGQHINYYFLGPDNYSAFFIIPMYTIIFYYDVKFYGKIKNFSIMLLFSGCIVYVLLNSVTCGLGLNILLILIFYVNKRKTKILKPFLVKMLFLYSILLVSILVFNVQNYLGVLLNSMKKDITLSSRTIIWDRSLKLILEKPLFGHGSFSNTMLFNVDYYILYGTTHAHNMILEILMRTGIFGLLFYFNYIYRSIVIENRKINIICLNVLNLGIIIFFIISFMDFYVNIIIYYVLIEIFAYEKKLRSYGRET